jgi:hypothetical protein
MQITTFEIHEGKLEAFKESIRNAVTFAEANGPQLLVEVYIDESAMRAHSCQIQPDSEAILAHWRMSDPYIQAVMETCTLTRVDIYGQPSDAVMAGLGPVSTAGVVRTITPGFTGFGRFAKAAAAR